MNHRSRFYLLGTWRAIRKLTKKFYHHRQGAFYHRPSPFAACKFDILILFHDLSKTPKKLMHHDATFYPLPILLAAMCRDNSHSIEVSRSFCKLSLTTIKLGSVLVIETLVFIFCRPELAKLMLDYLFWAFKSHECRMIRMATLFLLLSLVWESCQNTLPQGCGELASSYMMHCR